MQAIELYTRVKNGILRIPFHHKESQVKVIIMWENENENNYDLKNLEQIVMKLNKSKSFKKISDPVQWQKEIRNEWA